MLKLMSISIDVQVDTCVWQSMLSRSHSIDAVSCLIMNLKFKNVSISVMIESYYLYVRIHK